MLFNTFRLSSKQMAGISPAPALSIGDSVVGHLATAIQFRTVSNADITLIDSAQFEKFITFLAKTYPLVHAQLQLERVNQYALLYSWKGKNTKLKPALLMGHYDVVPVIQGTERLWKHKPFAAEIADGFLYGRGTLDDKVTAIDRLQKHPFPARLEGAVGYLQDYLAPEMPFGTFEEKLQSGDFMRIHRKLQGN